MSCYHTEKEILKHSNKSTTKISYRLGNVQDARSLNEAKEIINVGNKYLHHSSFHHW